MTSSREIPRQCYLLRDRDRMFGDDFTQQVQASGLHNPTLIRRPADCLAPRRQFAPSSHASRLFFPSPAASRSAQPAWLRRPFTGASSSRAAKQATSSAPASLIVAVHRNYFQPVHQEFSNRTLWSSMQRLHQCVQRAGSNSSVQGHRLDSGGFLLEGTTVVEAGQDGCMTSCRRGHFCQPMVSPSRRRRGSKPEESVG